MSDSDSSSSFDEGSVGCPEYEIEGDIRETSSKDEYEPVPSYAVEDDFIEDDTDMLLYADEPLADDSWIEEYERRREEHEIEMNELSLRLNGENPVNAWCNCGSCSTEHLVEAKETHCCTEIPKCVDALNRAGSQNPCITNHPGFDAICLNRWSLELASEKFKTRSGQKYKQVDSKDKFLRVVAYRQFTRFVYGYLKEKRIALPACAYHAIRTAFKEKHDDFRGFEDLEEAE